MKKTVLHSDSMSNSSSNSSSNSGSNSISSCISSCISSGISSFIPNTIPMPRFVGLRDLGVMSVILFAVFVGQGSQAFAAESQQGINKLKKLVDAEVAQLKQKPLLYQRAESLKVFEKKTKALRQSLEKQRPIAISEAEELQFDIFNAALDIIPRGFELTPERCKDRILQIRLAFEPRSEEPKLPAVQYAIEILKAYHRCP